MLGRRLRRATALACLLLLLTASSALAHWIADSGYVWEAESGEKCLKARSEISDGRDSGGFSKADGWPRKEVDYTYPYDVEIECQVGWERPAFMIYTQAVLFKWKVSRQEWALCAYTPRVFNQENASHVEVRKYWNRPCGNGWYATLAPTYTERDGKWKGGPMWSGGSHYLSDTSGATSLDQLSPPGRPSWITEDGTLNSSPPSYVYVLDSNGNEVGTTPSNAVWGPPASDPGVAGGSGGDPPQTINVFDEAGYLIGQVLPGEVFIEDQ
jgi:hypothetical protein